MLAMTDGSAYDFISNVRGRTFPRGMSIEIIRRSFFEQAIQDFDKPEYFEHVTLFFYQHEQYGRQLHITNHEYPEVAGTSLAIDTQVDFARAELLISRMTSDHTQYRLKDIIRLIESSS
jgi:spore coat polysaccharide biosynthesis protein SpsF